MTPQLPDISNAPDLPLGLSLLVAALLLLGGGFTFIGALGLACFRNFYDRLHMPTLGTTFGAIAVLLASALYSSYSAGHIILRDGLILFFLSLAAPISTMMLARAAAMRDFTQNWHDSSDNMFWQLAQTENIITDETDAEVKAALEQQEKQAKKAETAPVSLVAPQPAPAAPPKQRQIGRRNRAKTGTASAKAPPKTAKPSQKRRKGKTKMKKQEKS